MKDKRQKDIREGVYLATGPWGDMNPGEIEIYVHPVKGLCCFSEDFGSSGTCVDAEYDCHVSVEFTGLDFIERTGDIN